MYKTISKIVATLSLCLISANIASQDSSVRIAWNYRTFQELKTYTVSNDNNAQVKKAHYSRIKRLSNGDLLMLHMDGKFGWNIYARKSKDNGLTWSDAIIVRKSYRDSAKSDDVCYACPDFIELPNGQILVAYQWRYNNGYNDLSNTNKNCGIETIRSLNMGDSFIAASVKKAYWGRNWEPSFILLPTGELQMFFTDTHTLQCNAGMIRSFDNGNTWQPTTSANFTDCEYISRTQEGDKTYDGMVVGQYLDNNHGIAIALECDGGTQTPWIVRTSVENNWKYPDFSSPMAGPGAERKQLLHERFRGFAPYMEKLPTGEIIVQSNGRFTGQISDRMWVFIGDEEARNFSYASSPHASWWGSIAYIGDNEMISSGNAGYKEDGIDYQMLRIIKGKINRNMLVKKGEVEISKLQLFDRSVNNDWFIGGTSQAQAYVNMKYNDNNLSISGHVYDEKLNYYTSEKSDGIQLLIYRKNIKSGTEDIYRLTMSVAGDIKIEKKNQGGGYDNIDASTANNTIVLEGTLGDNSDIDEGYTTKTNVPWNLIGGFPIEDEEIRTHLIQKNTDRDSSIYPATTEYMPGESSSDSQTWMRIIFEDLSGLSIDNQNNNKEVNIFIPEKGMLKIDGLDHNGLELGHIRIFSVDGSCIFNKLVSGDLVHTPLLSRGVYIVQLSIAGNKTITQKILVH